jgi:enamine deaminase RidA (YjgF/YER057c/UK114 family)
MNAADCHSSDIVKLTIFLVDLNDFEELNQIMITFFDKPFPARSTIQVSALPKGALIEIDTILSK